MKKLIALLLLLPALASADPGAATRFLIEERTNLLDLGMLRLKIELDTYCEWLESRFEEAEGKAANIFVVFADYDFASDRISIYAEAWVNGEITAQGCKSVFDQLRLTLDESQIDLIFSHSGYSSTNRPDDLGASLLKRMRLNCLARNGERTLEVSGKLTDKKVSISEIE